MNRFFLVVAAPLLAVLLALLGVLSLPGNPIGWFLIVVGVFYAVGFWLVYAIRKERFWESRLAGTITEEERGDRSLWLIALGMAAVFFLSPVEYLSLPASLPRTAGLSWTGLGLAAAGTALFVWARRALGNAYSGHVSVKAGQALVQSGPYRFLRHPAYAGYLLMAFGIGLGYASLIGLALTFTVLVPSMVYRMAVEERLLLAHFGAAYRQYAAVVKRILPWIW